MVKGQFFIISILLIAIILLPILVTTYTITYTTVEESPQRIRTNLNKVLQSLNFSTVIQQAAIPIGNRDILLTLDSTGSMDDNCHCANVDTCTGCTGACKICDAKNASKTLLGCADVTDRVSLMKFTWIRGRPNDFRCSGTYGHGINQLTSYLFLDTTNKSTLSTQINSITTDGNTPIQTTLQRARDIILAQANASRNRMMILLSDGEETCGGDACNYVEDGNFPTGVPIYTIGLQISQTGQSELRCIANYTGGQYYNATTRDDLRRIFCQIVKGPAMQVEDFLGFVDSDIAKRLMNLSYNSSYTHSLSTNITNGTQVKISYLIQNLRESTNATFNYTIYRNQTNYTQGTENFILNSSYNKDVYVPFNRSTNYTSLSYLNAFNTLIINNVTLTYNGTKVALSVSNLVINYTISEENSFLAESVNLPISVLTIY